MKKKNNVIELNYIYYCTVKINKSKTGIYTQEIY